jgi:hypothetical protein
VNRRQATAHVALYRRTGHRSVRTKHAAIARKGLEPFAASFAVIEKLAGICRHRLDGLMTAFRASQAGLKLHIGSLLRTEHTTEAAMMRKPACGTVSD